MSFRTISKCLAAFALMVTTMNATEYAIAECRCPDPFGCDADCTVEQECCQRCEPLSSTCLCCESGETCTTYASGGFGFAQCGDPPA